MDALLPSEEVCVASESADSPCSSSKREPVARRTLAAWACGVCSFNTAGRCNPAYHHMLLAAERLPEAPGLVDEGGYFVVHAPRQAGNTTTLRALARKLTAAGEYAALHVSCEVARSIPSDNFEQPDRG